MTATAMCLECHQPVDLEKEEYVRLDFVSGGSGVLEAGWRFHPGTCWKSFVRSLAEKSREEVPFDAIVERYVQFRGLKSSFQDEVAAILDGWMMVKKGG